MKRLFTWLLILMLPLAGLAEEPLFTEGVPHTSHLDYRQYFETMSAEAGECTLSIAKDTYTEERAAQLYAQVAADEAALAELGDMRPHTVYVVKKPLAGLQRIGSAIYCTAAQVLDGSYCPWLAEAALDVETWRAVGLSGYIYGDMADESALTSWYADDAHDDMLSLFQAYFVPEFAAEDELHIARQTAIGFTAYIIREAGLEAALTADAAAYIPGWLASLGIDRPYIDPYAGLLDGYTWTRNQFYALIGTSPRGDVFKMNPLEYDMTTPVRVRMALCEMEKGMEAILTGVQRDAPDWYARLAKNYEAPITYEFKENSGSSRALLAARRVEAGAAFSLIHETAHIMTPCVFDRFSRYMDQWKVEAIAEYLTLTYYPGLIRQEDDWRYMQDETILALEEAEEKEFYERLRKNYLQYAPLPDTAQEVNEKLFWRLAVLTKDELDMEHNSVSDTYAGAGSASLDAVNGNELSYPEAEWLASYLINHHGLSAFLHYCLDDGVSFEEAFGLTYEAAKAEWLANRNLLD